MNLFSNTFKRFFKKKTTPITHLLITSFKFTASEIKFHLLIHMLNPFIHSLTTSFLRAKYHNRARELVSKLEEIVLPLIKFRV